MDNIYENAAENSVITISYPPAFLMGNTKLQQKLPALSYDKEYVVRVSAEKSRKLFLTYVTVFSAENDGVRLSAPIDFYDSIIIDAASSLYAKSPFVTPASIYKMMGGSRARPDTLKEIERRIDRLSTIKINIDFHHDMP